MQHVLIRLDKSGTITVDPHEGSIWRDDQWIMWILGPGLHWDPPADQMAVQFGDDWPGTRPSAQTPLTDPVEDRRAYVAYGQTPLNGSDPEQSYSYILWVAKDTDGVRTRVQATSLTTSEPIDPEIVNRPLP
ncbi:MAG TPA: hypothetical protein VF618_10205 [Thermoanaerobaculia bacterium]